MRIAFNMTPKRVTQFLKERPVDQIEDPDNPGEMIDEITEKQHITRWCIGRTRSESEQGRIKIEKEDDVPEVDGFTEED